MHDFKFVLGQKVKYTKGEVVGIVRQQRYIANVAEDLTRVTREYYIELSPLKKLWYMENVLESLLSDKEQVDQLLENTMKKSEKTLQQNRIDNMLKHKQFEELKKLHNND